MLTERQANLIAATLEELRPGDWRIQQTLDVLWENRQTPHDFKTLIQVATNAALNPSIKSPTSIYLDGKHWNLPEPPKHRPVNPKCPDHDWYDAHNCHACDADILEGNRPEQFRGHKMPKTPGARPANWKELTQHPATSTTPASTEPHRTITTSLNEQPVAREHDRPLETILTPPPNQPASHQTTPHPDTTRTTNPQPQQRSTPSKPPTATGSPSPPS